MSINSFLESSDEDIVFYKLPQPIREFLSLQTGMNTTFEGTFFVSSRFFNNEAMEGVREELPWVILDIMKEGLSIECLYVENPMIEGFPSRNWIEMNVNFKVIEYPAKLKMRGGPDSWVVSKENYIDLS